MFTVESIALYHTALSVANYNISIKFLSSCQIVMTSKQITNYLLFVREYISTDENKNQF